MPIYYIHTHSQMRSFAVHLKQNNIRGFPVRILFYFFHIITTPI